MHEYVPFSNTLVLFFVCLSLAQNIAWRKSDGKKVNRYREGKKTADIVIKRIQQTAAKVSPKMQSGYKKASVKDAWANHFAAFGAQKVDQIMQDYTDKSVLKAFDHTTGTLLTAKGLREIAQFFADLFAMLSDRSKLKAPVIETMEGTSTLDGSVYLIWSCSSSGITSATDTFIHDSANKIIRQNIAYESNPFFRPATTTTAPPATTTAATTTTAKPQCPSLCELCSGVCNCKEGNPPIFKCGMTTTKTATTTVKITTAPPTTKAASAGK